MSLIIQKINILIKLDVWSIIDIYFLLFNFQVLKDMEEKKRTPYVKKDE